MEAEVIDAEEAQEKSVPETARRPGRPRKDGNHRETILNKAEIAFAEGGYAGISIRDIADRAGVNQGLIRYYFDSKQQLFDEVYRRRGGLLSGHRHVLLDRLLDSGEPLTVKSIIRAYLQPQWDLKYSGEAGAAFVRLQARLHAEPEEHALRLRREVYDASVKRYVDALSIVLPAISKRTIGLRMAFLVGTYLFMLNDLGRIEDLTEGKILQLSKDEMLDHMVEFLTAGIQAPNP
ncbi:TetR family transcriptional regulator [Sphingomonas sp. Sph1(2015)]|uniref:TetR/AcrR family transcriptional regulator n=1 Tax=Sphingomonas TaxID=13687 RepID=UPI000975D78A|nr:TetR/AcrR family transcriptional regulator [Sphingomonas sp. Sph1(2015)]OMJ33327.1 TetR family transcriptional regulator [Sphingomonas sp. Sph1(2015)]